MYTLLILNLSSSLTISTVLATFLTLSGGSKVSDTKWQKGKIPEYDGSLRNVT